MQYEPVDKHSAKLCIVHAKVDKHLKALQTKRIIHRTVLLLLLLTRVTPIALYMRHEQCAQGDKTFGITPLGKYVLNGVVVSVV